MAVLEIVQLEVGLLQNFCEVLGCPQTGEAALVDPAFEVDRLLAVATKRGWTIGKIFITHTHDDHIAGLDEAVEATNATVYCHPLEVATVQHFAPRVCAVEDGERVRVGQGDVEVLYTPGHTPGCVCYYIPDPGALITGDVLFVGSCGGVKYPGSDPAAMVASLQRKIGALPETTLIYPGHDYGPTPTSRLGWELVHNPALKADTLEAFCAYKGLRSPSRS